MFIALAGRLGVKGGDEFKPLLFKPPIGEQGQAQIPHPHQNDGLKAGGAQFLGDFRGQFGHIIAQAAGAEGAEIGQILAQLRGLDDSGFRQGFAGHGGDAIFPQPGEAAQIDGEAINRLARNDGWHRFLQGAGKISKFTKMCKRH